MELNKEKLFENIPLGINLECQCGKHFLYEWGEKDRAG